MDESSVYLRLIEYFGDFQAVKIKESNGYGVYCSKVNSLLSKDNRYCILFCRDQQSPVGTVAPLSSLRWSCFQTLTSDKVLIYKPSFSYVPSRCLEYVKLQNVDKKKDRSVYLSKTLPVRVELMNGKKRNEYEPDVSNQWPEYLNLNSALETYECFVYIE